MDGGWSARPSCWPFSVGASASTAHRSTCMRCARRGACRSPSSRRRSRCIFSSGAIVVANVPALYRRFGLPAVTKAGALALARGVFGWAMRPRRGSCSPRPCSAAPAGPRWAAPPSMRSSRPGSCARGRPRSARPITARASAALIFSPLWVTAIALGFPARRAAIGVVTLVVDVGAGRAASFRARRSRWAAPDGDAPGAPAASRHVATRASRCRDRCCGAMSGSSRSSAGIGARAVRADRPDRAPLLAAGAGSRRAVGRARHGRRRPAPAWAGACWSAG